MIKTHKRKKAGKYRGKGQGTMGRGTRKKAKKAGHHGGAGMAGTGKRADHKKTLITKLYGNTYFGKQGITSRGTKKDKSNKINLKDIEMNLNTYIKKEIAKKTSKGIELDLSDYKILGEGELKTKLIITAKSASETAKEKIKKAGGELILTSSAESEDSE